MLWNADRPSVVGLGELLWDVFPDGKRPGGAPANVAYEAQQLGCQGVVASRVGDDDLGREILEFLAGKGLMVSEIQIDPEAPTGRVTVSFNAQHQPEYIIHEGVAWDFLECTSDWEQLLQQADAVCFGTLAQRSERSREAIHAAVQSTSAAALRVYDVNFRQNYFDRNWVERSLHLANVVKLNDEEVLAVSRMFSLPEAEAAFAQALLSQFGLNLVCITRGAKGCLVVDQQQSIEVPGEPITVADTVGAGDAFTAGLIFALLRGTELQLAAQFANRIGGIVASHPGAMPPVQADFALLIQQMFA